MKKLFALLLVCALLPLAPVQARAESRTTVMIYMCGSNLESQYGLASADIGEMLGADFDAEHTNVLLMLSGTQRWNMGFSADGTSICEIGRRGLRVLETRERMNMAEQDTLAYFLNYAWEHSDSDRYMLIVWDHGGGPLRGVCWDENYAPDNLTMPELTGALAESPFAQRKLDLIGFDACLMASLEVAWMVMPYAHYMVASEETEPGGGWDYGFLRGLEGDATSVDTGRRIVDGYVAGGDGFSDLTMSCIDLGAIPAVEDALSDFFYALQNGKKRPSYAELSAARRASVDFGREYRAAQSSGYDLVDLASLTDAYASYGMDKVARLRLALDAAVVYSRSNVADSGGLSIYFPFYNAEMYRSTGAAQYEALDFCPGYTSYMRQFGSYLLGDAVVSWAGIATRTEPAGSGERITAQLTDEQVAELASAQLVVVESTCLPGSDNASFRKIYDTDAVSLDGEGRLVANYAGEYMVFEVQEQGFSMYTGAVPYRVLESGYYLVEALASNRDDGSVWSVASVDTYDPDAGFGDSQLVQLLFSPPDEEGLLELRRVYVYDSLTESFTTRTSFRLEDYRYLHILDLGRTPATAEDGALLPYESWEELQGLENIDNPAIPSVTIETGNDWHCQIIQTPTLWRYAAFQVTDSQNRSYLTDLVLLDDSNIEYAETSVAVGGSDLVAVEPHCVYIDRIGAFLYVDAANNTPLPLIFLLDVDAVNGRPFTDGPENNHTFISNYAEVNPGDRVSLYLEFNPSDFGNDVKLERIDFHVSAYPFNSLTPVEVVQGSVRANVPVEDFAHQEPSVVFEPDPLTQDSPCLYEDENLRVRINTAMVTSDSVLLAATCESTCDADLDLYAIDGEVEGQHARFRGWTSGILGWQPSHFDAVTVPAGGSVLTWFELLRPEDGPDGVQNARLRLAYEDPAGPAWRVTTPAEIEFPNRVDYSGEGTRLSGGELRVQPGEDDPDRAVSPLREEVAVLNHAGWNARTIRAPMSPEERARAIGGYATVAVIRHIRDTEVLDPLWMIRLTEGEDGLEWLYPDARVVLDCGDATLPLFAASGDDGAWTLTNRVDYYPQGKPRGPNTSELDLTGARLYYRIGDSAGRLEYSWTPQYVSPELADLVHAGHPLYELHREDGANRRMAVGEYPMRQDSELKNFPELSVAYATDYPLRVALAPFDASEDLYVVYSFQDADGQYWSTDPILLAKPHSERSKPVDASQKGDS